MLFLFNEAITSFNSFFALIGLMASAEKQQLLFLARAVGLLGGGCVSEGARSDSDMHGKWRIGLKLECEVVALVRGKELLPLSLDVTLCGNMSRN